VLHAVLVAGDEAATDPAVVRVLARVVEEMRVAVETFDHSGADRRLLTEPDRRAEHENVGAHHLLVDLGPVVTIPPMFRHVGVHARGDIAIDGADHVDLDAVLLHDGDREVGEALSV
jgi:hypothetical protein